MSKQGSVEHRAKLSKTMKALWKDKKYRHKMVSGMNTEESHTRHSISGKKAWSKERRKEWSKAKERLWKSKEYNTKMHVIRTTKSYKKNQSEAHLKYYASGGDLQYKGKVVKTQLG